jgi:hypothetical protein
MEDRRPREFREPGAAAPRNFFMKRASVDSTAIRSAGYDDVHHVLEVRYADGDVYRYQNVPPLVASAFGQAPSKGHFLNTVVKRFFPVERVRRAGDR